LADDVGEGVEDVPAVSAAGGWEERGGRRKTEKRGMMEDK